MLHKSDNIRWLIHGDNSDMNITPVQAIKLQQAYADLLTQFEDLELPLLKMKCQIAVKVIDFVLESLNSMDIKKLDNASIIMRAMLVTNDPDISWLYDVDIADTANQRAVISELAIAITDYNRQKQKEKEKPKITLTRQAARMSNILGFIIDIKTTSVLQFLALQKEANEKIKWQKANR